MQKYKHLIFDFGGVFFDLKTRKKHGYIGDVAAILNIPLETAGELWSTHRDDLITGRETPAQFLAKVNGIHGPRVDAKEALERWRDLQAAEKERIDWKLVDYVDGLRKKYRVHLFTNTIDLYTGGGKNPRNHVADRFEHIFVSCEEGVTKSDKEAFLHVLKKPGAKPSECIFVDDHHPFVEAAKAAGITAILYTNLAALKKEFKRLGIAA